LYSSPINALEELHDQIQRACQIFDKGLDFSRELAILLKEDAKRI